MITKPWVIIVGSAAISGAAIAGVSYLLTKRSLEAKYEHRLTEEIALAKEFYAMMAQRDIKQAKVLSKKEKYASPKEALQEYQVQAEAYDTVEEGESVDESPVWDQEEEERSRTEEAPYVIHRDEFTRDKPDYDKICLTYYEKDDVIFDDRTTPLVDVDLLIGDANLKRFGEGSGKADVVFVRCDHLDTDWEITRSQGDYVEEVLGGIRHSDDHRKTKKFRLDDG